MTWSGQGRCSTAAEAGVDPLDLWAWLLVPVLVPAWLPCGGRGSCRHHSQSTPSCPPSYSSSPSSCTSAACFSRNTASSPSSLHRGTQTAVGKQLLRTKPPWSLTCSTGLHFSPVPVCWWYRVHLPLHCTAPCPAFCAGAAVCSCWTQHSATKLCVA